MEFVRYHTMLTSIDLAEKRGPFPMIGESIYDPENMVWQPPLPLLPYENDFGRPDLRWDKVIDGISSHGIRNSAQTTIAPTGTIATVAGCEGYGCEPVFALAYYRHVEDNGNDLKLTYTSPLFEQVLRKEDLPDELHDRIISQVLESGSCQEIEVVPEHIRHTFVVSQDIPAEDHVRMQAALQAFVDNSLSKTINFPEDAKVEDVAHTYNLAWELGCKGITVYVTGSRKKVVLETKTTSEKKYAPTNLAYISSDTVTEEWHDIKKPRPRHLRGQTYNVSTPLGKAFVTINVNGENQPFEVFINTAKAGSDTAAVSEAIGRLISYILRLTSPIQPHERLKEVWRQLSGIGGGRSLGFGPNRVRSLPDGVARTIAEFLEESNVLSTTTEKIRDEAEPKGNGDRLRSENALAVSKGEEILDQSHIGDLCPDCGQAPLVREEGCC